MKYFQKIKVRTKKTQTMGRYWGMNKQASHELNFHPSPADNEIFIDEKLKGRKKRQVIVHEKIEMYNMQKGMKYKQAHAIAEKMDKKVM
jgi:hypothetical protein